MANVKKEYFPQWIIGNRDGKYGGYGNRYKVDKYEEAVAKLILEVRGVDDESEDISIEAFCS